MASPLELRDGDRALAVIHPELGGWLTRYARRTDRHGWVEALYHEDAIVARYPDRMWTGNPVLFPHVSFNVAQDREGQYELNGRLIESPQHGFARRVPWTVTRHTENSATLEVRDSDRTRPSYPFAFRHELTYRLNSGRLEWEQVIENRDSQPLPFSTGFHPYLRVPLGPGGDRNRCFIRLPRAKRFNPLGKAEQFFDEPLPAQDLSVAEDVSTAVFLGDLAEREVALVDPTAALQVVLNFAENPAYRFLTLWSRSLSDPFYCLEPWTALPNSFGRPDGEVIVLPPGGSFRASLWLDVQPA